MCANFLKGVPLKLTDKFKPVPEVTVCTATCHIPVLFLEEECYDFGTERDAIDLHEMYFADKQCPSKASADAVHDNSASVANSCEFKPPGLKEQLPCLPVVAATNIPHSAYLGLRCSIPNVTTIPYKAVRGIADLSFNLVLHEEGLLKPVAASSFALPNGNRPTAQNHTAQTNFRSSSSTDWNNLLRFEDFENQGSSPFDAVALKSINDLEELRCVLDSVAEMKTGSSRMGHLESVSRNGSASTCNSHSPTVVNYPQRPGSTNASSICSFTSGASGAYQQLSPSSSTTTVSIDHFPARQNNSLGFNNGTQNATFYDSCIRNGISGGGTLNSSSSTPNLVSMSLRPSLPEPYFKLS